VDIKSTLFIFGAFKSNKMVKNTTSCCRFGVVLKCPVCESKDYIKDGKSSNEKQRYKCKKCTKRFFSEYTYNAYTPNLNKQIVLLTKEGMGIRSTARYLEISTSTVLKRIIYIAHTIKQPPVFINKVYEVDEICTFIKSKSQQIWIVYALERKSREVVSFSVGSRSNKTLSIVLKTLHFSNPKAIYTDGLKNYRYLVSEQIHRVKQYGTNHIERKNLTLRTHLKRLNRRSICFSKSLLVLLSVLKVYFWG